MIHQNLENQHAKEHKRRWRILMNQEILYTTNRHQDLSPNKVKQLLLIILLIYTMNNDIYIDYKPENINSKQLKIMVFVMNALEKGWTVKKENDNYTFVKKHENKKEVFKEEYLEQFLLSNFDIDTIK